MPSPSVALLRTQSDERLVALAAGGHERAFEAIVERYRRALLRYARRYLSDARAEDAVQQALVAAWTALRRGDEVHELRPWLHRIVHNMSLNALRVAGYDYDELRETLEGDGGPAEAAEHRAVVRGTLAGLAALPERQRDALLQIAVEGRSQDEVAAELGLTQNARAAARPPRADDAAHRGDGRGPAAARDVARDRRRRARGRRGPGGRARLRRRGRRHAGEGGYRRGARRGSGRRAGSGAPTGGAGAAGGRGQPGPARRGAAYDARADTPAGRRARRAGPAERRGGAPLGRGRRGAGG